MLTFCTMVGFRFSALNSELISEGIVLQIYFYSYWSIVNQSLIDY